MAQTQTKKAEVKKAHVAQVTKAQVAKAPAKPVVTQTSKPAPKPVEKPVVEKPKAVAETAKAPAKPVTKAETVKAETKQVVSSVTQIVVNGKPLSAGAQVREMFTKALEAGKIKAEQVKILTDADKTKEAFGLRYAMLKPATDNPEDRKVNGFARYGKATVKVNGKDYFVCNDIYARNIPKFTEWIKSLK